MSDVVVSVTESTTAVTVSEQDVAVAVTENPVTVSASTAGLQGIPGATGAAGASYTPGDPIYVTVRNATGSTLAKGSIVYTSGGNGTHTQVSLALATSDATSARVLGWLSESIANNASGLCQVEGYLDGINTQGITEGTQLYLSGTVVGSFQTAKPQAPVHLVYVGVAVKASAGNGRVYVKVQNGYELDELHDVQIISKADHDVIQYDSASTLWKNVAATALSVGTATTISGSITRSQVSDFTSGTVTSANTAGTATYATTSGTAVSISGSITKSQVSDFTSGTVAVATTATSATSATTAGTATYATTSGTAVSISGSITKSQVSDFTSGTVAQATNSSTAVYATTSGTATYATTSGTSVSISGSITKSQVSDFTSGTVTYATTSGTSVSISGSITKSQVSDFTNGTVAQATNASTATYATTAGTSVGVSGSAITRSQISDFASGTVAVGTANALLAGANTFTAGQTISNGTAASTALVVISGTATNKAVVVRGAASQSANLAEWQTSAAATAAFMSATGGLTAASLTTAGTVTFTGSVAALITGGTAGTSGQVLTSAGTGASPTWSSVSASTALTAGTAFYANTSGTATAVSGSAITESQVVNLVSDLAAKAPISYVYTSSAVITNSFPSTTTAISVFGGTATPTFGFTVSNDSTYEYEFYGYLQQTGALSSQTPTWSIGSTAVTLSPVVAHVTDFGFTTNTTGLTTTATLSKARTTTGVAMTAITTASRYYDVVAKGIIRVTGTGTVKLYPALSATVSVDNVWTWRDGTTFKLTYIGNATATAIGTWS